MGVRPHDWANDVPFIGAIVVRKECREERIHRAQRHRHDDSRAQSVDIQSVLDKEIEQRTDDNHGETGEEIDSERKDKCSET